MVILPFRVKESCQIFQNASCFTHQDTANLKIEHRIIIKYIVTLLKKIMKQLRLE